MSATKALQAAREAGVTISARGDELMLEAKAPPPPSIIDALRQHKAEIVALLASRQGRRAVRDRAAWDAEDWRADFDECAGILEYDGGLPCDEAERRALHEAVQHWLCAHPPSPGSPEDGCVLCALRTEPYGNILLSVLAREGHAWVHVDCYEPWMTQLKREALAALSRMGIVVQAAAPATDSKGSPSQDRSPGASSSQRR